MRISTYGFLCLIAGLVCEWIIVSLASPWYVNFAIGFTTSMIMLGLVPSVWRINADQ